jgi:2-haloacid dehalogenase
MGKTMQARPLTTIVFDIGNVLIEWNPRNLYAKLFADPARMEWFLANVCNNSWNLEQDRGRPFAEAIIERIQRFPEWETEIRAYDTRWDEMVSGEIEGSVAALRALQHGGWPIYAITNFSREKYVDACRRFAFLNEFRGTIVSAQERMLKPSPEIFELFLSRYGLSAGECLFVDDSAANVAAAANLGFHAHHFGGAEGLHRELVRRGLLPGLPDPPLPG